MDLHVLRSPESENHIFSKWSVCMFVYVCVCICVWVCVTFISITQKQNIAETSKLVFYICIMYRCYLKLFIKIGQIPCVQGHTKKSNTLTLMEEFFCYWFFPYLDWTKYNKVTYVFVMLKNTWTTKKCLNGIHNLSTGQYEKIRVNACLFLEIAEGSLPVILSNF